jgi:hypothetical protein
VPTHTSSVADPNTDRRFRVTDVTGPESSDIDVTAEFVGDGVTTESPPILRRTLRSQSSHDLTHLNCPPSDVSVVERTGGDRRIVLTTADIDPETDSCWQIPYRSLNLGMPCTEETVSVGPGQPFRRDYVVLAHPRDDGCFTPGAYTVPDGYTRTDGTELDLSYTVSIT